MFLPPDKLVNSLQTETPDLINAVLYQFSLHYRDIPAVTITVSLSIHNPASRQ